MARSDTARGVVLMNVAMLSFTLNDTAMKVAAETVPLFQATTLRGVLATAGLVVLARLRGKLRLWPGRRDGGLIALRTLADVVATLTFLLALTQMPLVNLSAIMQSLPLVGKRSLDRTVGLA